MLSSASLAFLGLPGGAEWIIILVIALLLFGRRLPEIMRGLGGSVREFKQGLDQGPSSTSTPPANPPSASSPEGTVSRNASAPADEHKPKDS